MISLTSNTYAKQARSIVNIARVNEDPKAKLIRGLYIGNPYTHRGFNPIPASHDFCHLLQSSAYALR